MTDWLPIVGDLVNCITGFTMHPFGIELSTECIESNLIPRVALDHINQMSNVVISGTNPAPRNRSWLEVNGPAIALIVVMAVVCAIAVFAVVVCVMCERRTRKRKSESADDEELSEASENPLANGRSARGIEQERGQQTVSRCSSLCGAYSEQSGTEMSVGASEAAPMMTYGAPVSKKDAKTRDSAAPTNQNLKSVGRLREGSEGAPRTAPKGTAETVPTKAAAPSKPYSNPPPSSHVQGQGGVPQYQPYQLHPQNLQYQAYQQHPQNPQYQAYQQHPQNPQYQAYQQHPQNPQYQPYPPPQQPQRYPQYREPQQYLQHQYYPAYQTPA